VSERKTHGGERIPPTWLHGGCTHGSMDAQMIERSTALAHLLHVCSRRLEVWNVHLKSGAPPPRRLSPHPAHVERLFSQPEGWTSLAMWNSGGDNEPCACQYRQLRKEGQGTENNGPSSTHFSLMQHAARRCNQRKAARTSLGSAPSRSYDRSHQWCLQMPRAPSQKRLRS
jgi:hypothetical protein